MNPERKRFDVPAFRFQKFNSEYRRIVKAGRAALAGLNLLVDGPCEITFPNLAPIVVFEGEAYKTGLSKIAYEAKRERLESGQKTSIRWQKLDNDQVVGLAKKLARRPRGVDYRKTSISPLPKK